MKEPNTVNRIKKELWLPHPIEKVWKAITQKDSISKWLAPTNFEAKEGFSYEINSKKEGCNQIFGKIKKAQPYNLTYTWTEASKEEIETEVSWQLSSKDNGTLVILEHISITNNQSEEAIKLFNNFNQGWTHCLTQIKILLNR